MKLNAGGAGEAEINDYFGHSVSTDGDWVVAGAYYSDGTASEAGAVYVFH